MNRAPGPSDNILFIYKTVNWKRNDTMLVVVLHNGINLKRQHHPKVFQRLAFNQEVNMN